MHVNNASARVSKRNNEIEFNEQLTHTDTL